MGVFKAYMLGLLSAYGIFYITRKGADGKSILDELLERPDVFIDKAKSEVITDTARVVNEMVK